MKTKPDIYSYTDVKKYLKEYRDFRRVEDPGFSNTHICYVLGQIHSNSYFNNVVSGRVRIGTTIIDRFNVLLELTPEEFTYFRNLVNYSQSRTAEERETYFRQLIKSSRISGKEIQAKLQAYYDDWYHPVVRAFMDLASFDGENYGVLLARMNNPISLPNLKQSVALLIELGLIRKNDQGFYKPADSVISSGSEIEQDILLQFQEKTMNHSRSVIQNEHVSPQKITTMTVSVSKNAYQRIIDRITELKHEIRAIAGSDTEEAEELCQVVVHLYPYTRNTK